MSTRRRHLASIILKILWIKGFDLMPVEIYLDLVFNTKKISFVWMYFKRLTKAVSGWNFDHFKYNVHYFENSTLDSKFCCKNPIIFFGSMIIMNVVQNCVKYWYGHFDIVHIGINGIIGTVHRSFSWLKKQNLKIRKNLYWKIADKTQRYNLGHCQRYHKYFTKEAIGCRPYYGPHIWFFAAFESRVKLEYVTYSMSVSL